MDAIIEKIIDARHLKGAQWGNLFAARALRLDVIGSMSAPV